MNSLKKYLSESNIPFQEQVSLKQKSRIKCGGVCNIWIMPNCMADLKKLGIYLYAHQINFDIVGQTSNLFFTASYNPLVVISTIRLCDYVIEEDKMICSCGVSVSKLARESVIKGYEGFYGLVGLPGTVGAAIYNNAGCYNCSLSSMLYKILILNEKGEEEILSKEDLLFSHRSSLFKRKEKKGIILSVILDIKQGDSIQENEKAKQIKCFRSLVDEPCPRTLGSVYSTLVFKSYIKLIIKILSLFSKLFLIKDKSLLKKILLFMYGDKSLDKYISDRNLNTFIWRDEQADIYFFTYRKFMEKICDGLTMEIEIKS